ANGEVGERDEQWEWQEHRVYNYIAPTVEMRCARIGNMRQPIKVRAFSDEEKDLRVAQLCSDILANVYERIALDEIVRRALVWSETCGTAFYCVTWDDEGGRLVGYDGETPVYEGEVAVSVLPPFEIYPDSLAVEEVEKQASIIRARAVPVRTIFELYGVELPGSSLEELGGSPYAEPSLARDSELLIERYTAPTALDPLGRTEIVAGDHLLYEGPLPAVSGEKGKRAYPFVKQVAIALAGRFFGTSVVERLIPLQRAYNAVRNRKQELLNRIALGVLAVEDGSVDTEELARDGLSPGKIIVYRQGSEPPKLLDPGAVSQEFDKEEERLSEEFIVMGGASDLSKHTTYSSGITTATGLRLLIDRDDMKLGLSVRNMFMSEREVAKKILRLYKEFVGEQRLVRMTGEGKGVRFYYFDRSDLTADDVCFEEGQEPDMEKRRATLFELLEKGLLSEEDGTLSLGAKNRILEAIGCGAYGDGNDLTALHVKRASEENLQMLCREAEVSEIDDHDVHEREHIRYLLSDDGKKLDQTQQQRVRAHILTHRSMKGGTK
ncbi:MAG: hypothetical protein ACI4U2_04890, partial [Christensenellaceae bacterium]